VGRINIEKLNKTYANRRKDPRSDENPLLRKGDRVTVLSNIDLNIQDGEMVCFLARRAAESRRC
jgi:ABC-type multidrug transport system ATPase subunit